MGLRSAAWRSQSATTRCTWGIVRRRRSGRGGKSAARAATAAHLGARREAGGVRRTADDVTQPNPFRIAHRTPLAFASPGAVRRTRLV